jgi:propanol-preferring alcohol dehydrogenase
MKAMVLRATAPVSGSSLERADIPQPSPGGNEILLKIAACGVCHTDLHAVEGELPLPKLPLVPGHQIVAHVEALGAGARRFKVGDRVGVVWLNRTCGRCEYCKRGLENLCENAKFTGYDVDGGYAEYVTVHEDFAYPIPEGFDDAGAAPLLCAGVIGYRALRLSEIEPGGRLGLFGFGASAHVAIQIARHWGCEVYVFTRSREHMELAESLGAVWTGTAKERAPKKLTNAVLFAPVGSVVHDALRALDKGGTLAINAIYLSPIPETEYALIYDERTVRSVTASTRRDAEELLKLAGEIPIRTEVETFPLEEANRALVALKESRIRGAGVLMIE